MKYIYIICALFAIFNTLPTPLKAQSSIYEPPFPLREIRAVWLTTLNGLDWPRAKANSLEGTERQKAELCQLLDAYQRANINTVLLQTRIRGTVIYPSALEPWDDCLTGTPGRSPGYDPLAFCIDECHRRGMELHAWVVTIPLGKNQSLYGSSSIARRHKSLCRRTRSGEMFMIPAHEGTADYVAALCREIAQRYDIDGISLDYIRYPESTFRFSDDDFYPRGPRASRASRKNQKSPTPSALADFRRDNITRIVRRVHDAVKPLKPWVKLSSSPIGKYSDLSRYSSAGWNCRDAVYQDPQLWLRHNLQDMLFPMMYFLGDHFYPFLFDWLEHSYGHPVAPGLGIYFLDPRYGSWRLNDVRAQVYASRRSAIGGIAFYRGDFLTRNVQGLYTALCRELCPYPALTPRMTWMGDTIAPPAPVAVRHGRHSVAWTVPDGTLCNLYGSATYPVDTARPENLLAVRLRSASYPLTGRSAQCRYFAVTAIDRFGNESRPAQEAEPAPRPAPPHVARLINPSSSSKMSKKAKKRRKR